MTPQDFKSLCITLVGKHKWKEQIAILLSVSERRIRYWLAGEQEIPEGVIEELHTALEQSEAIPAKWIKGLGNDKRGYMCHAHYPCFFYDRGAKKIYPIDTMLDEDIAYYRQKIANMI